MPAKSKAQQQAAGIARAIQKGEKKPKKGTASAEMAKMSSKDLKKFAETPRKGLPKKVKKEEDAVLGRGMSKSAKARDVEQSDREYIAQQQKKWKKANAKKKSKTNENTKARMIVRKMIREKMEEIKARQLVRQALQEVLSDAVQKPSRKIQVQCMECGKKFSTTKMNPKCPRCGGYDIDLA